MPDSNFTHIVTRAIVLPVALLLAPALVLAFSVFELVSVTRSVAGSDRLIAQTAYVERLLVDMETGLRGYGLAGSEFLEPYSKATQSIGPAFADLAKLTAANPQQAAAVNRLQASYSDLQRFSTAAKSALDDDRSSVDWAQGKTIMDQMRAELARLTATEVALRDGRSQSAQRAAEVAACLAIGFTAVVGAGIGWLIRRQLLALAQTYWRSLELQKQGESEREQLLVQAKEDKEAERAARAEAERANRMKDEFLSNLSHELRTPLNAILGWAELLEKNPLDGEMKQGIEVIGRNARIQTQLIEDLLDMSRIIAGKIRLDIQRIDIAAVIRAAIDTLRPAAEGKKVSLQAVLGTVDRQVAGDPARLQQVVWNLLSNAIKFTPKGGRVQVLLERVNSHIEITVSDTGQGIQPDFLPYVFDRFRQADSTTTRRQGGMGLGLAIVKQLVELHGGTVQAQSPGEGQGSTFIVTLPLTPVHAEPIERSRHHPSVAPLSAHDDSEQVVLQGINVLVVDDEPDARELIGRILKQCEANVLLAGSGKEALEILQREPVSVLISDIGMPDQDGYDLIREVRSLPGGRHLPAVALTAFARSEDRRRALRAGFQMHVVKPVEPAELIAVVASVANRPG